MSKDDSQKSPDLDTLESESPDSEERAPGFFAIVTSTIAAAFGVQSSRNYQRDFKRGNIWVFIASGIIFTILFVLVVAAVVTTVLSQQAT